MKNPVYTRERIVDGFLQFNNIPVHLHYNDFCLVPLCWNNPLRIFCGFYGNLVFILWFVVCSCSYCVKEQINFHLPLYQGFSLVRGHFTGLIAIHGISLLIRLCFSAIGINIYNYWYYSYLTNRSDQMNLDAATRN